MALIQCPECGNEVSSAAKACPKCGYPISDNSVTVIDESNITIQNPSSSRELEPQMQFPNLPTVMNVGKQIVNWGFDAAIQGAHYVQEINHTRYIKEGEVSIMAHTNGICISGGLNFFYIAHEQIIDMKFLRHTQLTTENKSVIGRAVVGGLLLGPLAAVVGGMSGIGTKVKSLGEYLFAINFWDIYTHQVQTILICTNVEGVRFIERVESEKAKNNVPEGNNYVCNILGDNGQIADEKMVEAVKLVGQEKVAEAIVQIEGCGEITALQKVQQIGARNNLDTSQYKSAGCLVTLLVMLTSIASFCALLVLVI